MKNVSMSRDGDKLIISVNLSDSCGMSKSGKSELIATTGGNVDAPGAPGVKVGLNIYKK